MQHLEARFKVVTPCFMGGANANDAELRVPSIKGALRFWWRALTYAECTAEAGPEGAVKQMADQERMLFGSDKVGQSRIVLSLEPSGPKDNRPKTVGRGTVLGDGPDRPVGPGARYLGYGVLEAFASRNKGTKAGELTRDCLQTPFYLVLRIGAKKRETLENVVPALRLFGLVGGLGAKSRKGYGSVNLIGLEGDGLTAWQPPRTVADYRTQLGSLLQPALACPHEPETSAFSARARVELMFENRVEPMAVLDDYGKAMVRYRSWGRNGKILGNEPSDKRFPEDHAWMKGDKRGPPTDFHPRRAVFGLPHNYGKSTRVTPQNHDRRASPLFFHVHEIGNRHIGIALLLRSRFLPEGEKIRAGNRSVPARPDWGVLETFLEKNSKRKIWPDG